MNVDHLRAELPALRLMRSRTQPPATRDPTTLEGGVKVGIFWRNCKQKQRCYDVPYNRLLANPVLKSDYRNSHSVTRGLQRNR